MSGNTREMVGFCPVSDHLLGATTQYVLLGPRLGSKAQMVFLGVSWNPVI